MAATDTDADRVDLSKPITLTTFHPDWETVDKSFWTRRIFLMIFAVFFMIVILWVGYNYPGSVMPTLFSGDAQYIRIIEFAVWWINGFLFLEMVQIANHKTRTTKIKYALSKNEEMRISISFNKALSRLFIGIFLFTFLKIVIKEILGYKFEDSNIWRMIWGTCMTTTSCGWQVWLLNALYVCIGFGSYAQFLYTFEKVVQGRKHPFLWIITPIGLFIMIFVPYNIPIVDFVFTSTLHWNMESYFFGQWFAIIGGGIMVPILYLVMGKRFAFSGHEQTSKDCYNKGIGFTIAALGNVFDVVAPLVFLSWGGILAFFEAFFWVFTGPILTLVGIFLVRKAYRPRG